MLVMTSVKDLRAEARNPETSPERLHELIHLEGDRGDADSGAGWCREEVAGNPSARLDTLQELATDADDTMARFNAVRNPSLDEDTLRLLAEDRLDFIANAARERLGLPLRPRPVPHVVHIPRIDPKTGQVLR
jgi:hypothetical protein